MARSTSTRRLWVLVAMALVAASCGGDDPTTTATEAGSTTTVPGEAPADDEAADEPADSDDADDSDDGDESDDLEAMLLTAADLPTGYVPTSDDGSDDDGTDGDDDAPEFCEEAFDPFDDDLDGEDAEVQFQRGEFGTGSGAIVVEILARNDEQVMAERFAELPGAFEQCAEFTIDEDGITMTGTFTPLALSSYGDETIAMRIDGVMDLSDDALPVAGDMVFVRDGGVVMIVMTFTFGERQIPTAELDQIVEAGAAKL